MTDTERAIDAAKRELAASDGVNVYCVKAVVLRKLLEMAGEKAVAPQEQELEKAIKFLIFRLDCGLKVEESTCNPEFQRVARIVIEAAKQIQVMGQQLDHLLAHCKDSECEECSKIICPHQDPMHFHHDGCPSCVGFDVMRDKLRQLQSDYDKALEALVYARRRVCSDYPQQTAVWKGNIDEALSTPSALAYFENKKGIK